MTAELPAPVFRKTKQGKWAVMGPVETLQAALDGGGRVKVSKKSGGFSDFTVVSMGRPFDVDGIAMCYGYDDAGEDQPATAGHRPQAQGPPGRPSPEPPPRDDNEPMPEFRGDETDEWNESY